MVKTDFRYSDEKEKVTIDAERSENAENQTLNQQAEFRKEQIKSEFVGTKDMETQVYEDGSQSEQYTTS